MARITSCQFSPQTLLMNNVKPLSENTLTVSSSAILSTVIQSRNGQTIDMHGGDLYSSSNYTMIKRLALSGQVVNNDLLICVNGPSTGILQSIPPSSSLASEINNILAKG